MERLVARWSTSPRFTRLLEPPGDGEHALVVVPAVELAEDLRRHIKRSPIAAWALVHDLGTDLVAVLVVLYGDHSALHRRSANSHQYELALTERTGMVMDANSWSTHAVSSIAVLRLVQGHNVVSICHNGQRIHSHRAVVGC